MSAAFCCPGCGLLEEFLLLWAFCRSWLTRRGISASANLRSFRHDYCDRRTTKNRNELSQLEQLRNFTVVVADTGDFQSIKEFKPRDARQPSLIYAATQKENYFHLLDEVLAQRKNSGSPRGPDRGHHRSSAGKLAPNSGDRAGVVSTRRMRAFLSILTARSTMPALDQAFEREGVDRKRC